MHGGCGTVRTLSDCQTQMRHCMAVPINVSLSGLIVVVRGSKRNSKLSFAAKTLGIYINPFEHVHKLVGRGLLGFCALPLAANPRECRRSEDEAEDTHQDNTNWHRHCKRNKRKNIRLLHNLKQITFLFRDTCIFYSEPNNLNDKNRSDSLTTQSA